MNLRSPDESKRGQEPGGGTGDGRPGGRSGRLRLTVALAAAAALMTAAALLAPAGAIRLLVMTGLGLPALILMLSRPRYVLALILFIMFSNIDIFISVSTFRPLVILVAVSIAAAWLDGQHLAVRDRTFLIMMAAFYLVGFQSMAFAENLSGALNRMETLAGIYVVVLAVTLLVDTKSRFLVFLAVLTAATMVSNFLPFLVPPPDYYSSKTLMWDVGVLRYEGYRLEPNFFALYQIFIIPILLFFFVRFERPRIARPLILLAIAGTLYVLMLSFSRGGFVSLLVIIVSLIVLERGSRVLAAVSIAILAAIAIAVPALYWERITTLYEASRQLSEDYSILVRVRTMQVALMLGLRNPLFGVGIDNFLYQTARFIPFAKVVHNFLLQIFSELGLPGLAVVAAIIARNIRILRRMMRKASGREEARIGMFLMVQQIAVIINAMFIPVAYESILWLTLAMPTIAHVVYSEKAGEPVLR